MFGHVNEEEIAFVALSYGSCKSGLCDRMRKCHNLLTFHVSERILMFQRRALYFPNRKNVDHSNKIQTGSFFTLADIKSRKRDKRNIRIVWYDASSQEFKDPKTIRVSDRIQCLDPKISLKHAGRNTALRFHSSDHLYSSHPANIKTFEVCAFPGHGMSYSIPPTERPQAPGQPNLHETTAVQATDGPYENVDYRGRDTAALDELLRELTRRSRRTNCRYPEYIEEDSRRRSYGQNRWPHPAELQDTNRLAKCGFYYTGTFDMVRCYQCGLGLKDWSYTDDPWMEHFRYSQHCHHVLDSLEPAVLDRYKATVAQSNPGSQNAGASAPARLRHPEYAWIDARLKTYAKWPSSLRQTPDNLAEAGFYYTGLADQVRCYACDGGLQHWDTDDEPWIEHARWFPHCTHVKDSKGQYFVDMVQRALQEDDELDLDTETATLFEEMGGLDVNGAPNGHLESDDPIYSPEAQKVVLSLGYSKAAVKMAIQECREKQRRWNAEILAGILLEKQDRGETLPLDSPRSESPVLNNTEDVQTEHRRRKQLLLCILCEERDRNALFLPCGHHQMCMECAKDAQICPACEKEVKQKVRTFMI